MEMSAIKTEGEASAKLSPMMAQYFEIKSAHPDSLLFYRMGDFYELFFEDAEIASRALGIVLTRRGRHDGEDIRMCGVPVERADDYLHRLIRQGHRVAVCEQLEDPAEAKKRGAKSVVRRDVVRLVTPGTITEERLLEPGRPNWLLTVTRLQAAQGKPVYGLAALDISTGVFSVFESDEAALAVEIARLEPNEIVAPESLFADPAFARVVKESRVSASPMGREASNAEGAERRIADFYGVETLDGFGAFTRPEIAAAGLALAYLKRTQFDATPHLAPPARRRRGATLEIDAATRANLEFTRTVSGERAGSVLHAIDWTKTPAGARLIAERLASPLTDVAEIVARQDAVAFFLEAPALRDAARALLSAIPDFARALARLGLDRGGPRDLAALGQGLAASAAMVGKLEAAAHDLPAALVDAYARLKRDDGALRQRLAAVLADDLPLKRSDGDFVRAGASAALDEARALRDESRAVILQLQARYVEETGVRQLKIKHNNMLGYFLEAPQASGEALLKPPCNATFIHRQTMAGAMRFTTPALVDLETRIASAADRALGLEISLFAELVRAALEREELLRGLGAALAEIDVAAALAELAVRRDWVRPRVDASLDFRIEAGRHPVVEAALAERGDAFVANDCELSGRVGEGGRMAVVTGPNMAGKSTFLRQNALIVALAQMGAFVPAKSARIGVVDRLFSRVGAADDLARGRSTFMVEMVETAAILNQATERSLVILDEIGRGTATFDGLSIAFACVEHLNAVNRSRTLFATHFHELTTLSETTPRLFNLTMKVREYKGTLVFLHEVAQGAADRSYGIQVAKLAGLPQAVIKRARGVLAELEATKHTGAALGALDALPLFSGFRGLEPLKPDRAEPEADALRDKLAELAPDEMSPRDALAALYELKRLL